MSASAADRSSRIAAALASSSVVHAARGPSPLAVKLIAGHGARASGAPAGTPPGSGDSATAALLAGCLETPGDPRGRTPARTHPVDGAPERRCGADRCVPGSPQRRRVRLPGASVPCPAITPSDTEVRENAHTAAQLAASPSQPAYRPSRTRTVVLCRQRVPILTVGSLVQPRQRGSRGGVGRAARKAMARVSDNGPLSRPAPPPGCAEDALLSPC
jgi:hypothetical protein